MEDNLNILKVKYLSNHLLDHTQIQKRRRPPMEDNLNILKVEYLSNRFLDHTQILNLS